MNRTTWNLSQHYAKVPNIIGTVLTPPVRVFFATAAYLCSCSLIYLRSLLASYVRKISSLVCGYEGIKQWTSLSNYRVCFKTPMMS